MPQIVVPISSLGPLIDVSIGVSRQREEALKKASQPIPPRITVQALIDTGCSCTCVDSSVLASLLLAPTSTCQIHTGSTTTSPHTCNVYDISLIIPDPKQSKIIEALQITDINLKAQGQSFAVLLGRDVLASAAFFYNGRGGQLILVI